MDNTDICISCFDNISEKNIGETVCTKCLNNGDSAFPSTKFFENTDNILKNLDGENQFIDNGSQIENINHESSVFKDIEFIGSHSDILNDGKSTLSSSSLLHVNSMEFSVNENKIFATSISSEQTAISSDKSLLDKDGKWLMKGRIVQEAIENFYCLKCDICECIFQTIRCLFKHFEDTHNIKGYIKCCNTKIFSRHTLIYHMIKHTNPDAFSCFVCHKFFSCPMSLKVHFKLHSYSNSKKIQDNRNDEFVRNTTRYHCSRCNKRYTYLNNFRKHINVCQKLRLKCTKCSKILFSKRNLNLHMKTHDSNTKVKCIECNKILKNREILHKHKQIHSNEVFKCDNCPYFVNTRKLLVQHMKNMHLHL